MAKSKEERQAARAEKNADAGALQALKDIQKFEQRELKSAGLWGADEAAANKAERQDLRQKLKSTTAADFDPSAITTAAATYGDNTALNGKIQGAISDAQALINDNNLGYRTVTGDKESGTTVQGGFDVGKFASLLSGQAGADTKFKGHADILNVIQNGLTPDQEGALKLDPKTGMYSLNTMQNGEDYKNLLFTKDATTGEYNVAGGQNYVYQAPKVEAGGLFGNEILNMIGQIAASYFGGPIGAGVYSAASGGDIGDILTAAGTTYLGGQLSGTGGGAPGGSWYTPSGDITKIAGAISDAVTGGAGAAMDSGITQAMTEAGINPSQLAQSSYDAAAANGFNGFGDIGSGVTDATGSLADAASWGGITAADMPYLTEFNGPNSYLNMDSAGTALANVDSAIPTVQDYAYAANNVGNSTLDLIPGVNSLYNFDTGQLELALPDASGALKLVGAAALPAIASSGSSLWDIAKNFLPSGAGAGSGGGGYGSGGGLGNSDLAWIAMGDDSDQAALAAAQAGSGARVNLN